MRVSVTRDAVAAAETGWCCADEEAPPAQALRELLSPGVGMLGPGGQGGPAPGSCLLRRQVACLDLLPQWALSLHGGHRAQGLGAAGGFWLTPDPDVTKGPPSPAREGGQWREVRHAHQGPALGQEARLIDFPLNWQISLDFFPLSWNPALKRRWSDSCIRQQPGSL